MPKSVILRNLTSLLSSNKYDKYPRLTKFVTSEVSLRPRYERRVAKVDIAENLRVSPSLIPLRILAMPSTLGKACSRLRLAIVSRTFKWVIEMRKEELLFFI